ncbi:MAG: MarR family transcriptional regulator [Staphylococcus equorum]|uniref:MarR family winged helix-turn-helix transcriptional regulator n=1 Tax=Staphylococcus sp. TaxID=29387 RepID=UPI00181C8016|nr:MarR family transcriptional regulator [Staphylococcus sp.]MDN5830190.1 MarR family transcriptional regulator [Staphylococcus equorum]MDN6571068.1 MarR family transcriptional regulator [Staphylococcus equorum]MDN6612066.1 MarR family transcriptional regulator [Staphylococcus equorum]NWN86780.1 MarR family transcriptional regulator [Staphylococcus sp.]
MEQNKSDYEHILFYFAYKTFNNTADEIIEKYGLNRQHHRFLFFIDKVPGITIKQLLKSMEITKQGSYSALRKLRDENLITEVQYDKDRRVKKLYPTKQGKELVYKLNKAQNDLFQEILKKVGNDWYAIMEEFAAYRSGYKDIKYLKDK